MSEEGYSEEKYIGERRFRKLDDGRVVEVTGDGGLMENIIVDGELLNSYSTSFEDLSRRLEGGLDEAVKPSSKKPTEKEFEDTVERAIKKWGGNIDSIPKGGQLDSGGKLGGGAGVGAGNAMKVPEDPLSKALKGKPQTYSEHMEKVRQEYSRQHGGGASASMQSGLKKKVLFKK